MDMTRRITATTPGRPALQRSLADIHAMLTSARSADSADIHCMLLDAGEPVSLTVRGVSVTLTPEARP